MTAVSWVSSVPPTTTTTLAGGPPYACSADQDTRPHSEGEPCWKHRDHLLLSDRVEGRTLLGLGVRSAVSFLHPGSVWSTREKHFFYHSSLYIYEQSLIHPNKHHSSNNSIIQLISLLQSFARSHFWQAWFSHLLKLPVRLEISE